MLLRNSGTHHMTAYTALSLNQHCRGKGYSGSSEEPGAWAGKGNKKPQAEMAWVCPVVSRT
jgi:hypothetical protein